MSNQRRNKSLKQNKKQSDFDFIKYKKRKKSFVNDFKNDIKSCRNGKVYDDISDIEQHKELDFQGSFKSILKSKQKNETLVVGICGGSCSGKTFISQWLHKEFLSMNYKVNILKEKNFLKSVDIENEQDRENYLRNYDFDNPQAVDWVLFQKALSQLLQKQPFNTPIYDIFDHKRITKTIKLFPCDLIIIEGRLFWNNKMLKENCSVKIFLDTDLDLMLSRRVFKNIARKIPLDQIINKYTQYVKPAYEKYIEPTKEFADLVIPNFGGLNFDFSKFKQNYEILKILKDLLKFRLKSAK